MAKPTSVAPPPPRKQQASGGKTSKTMTFAIFAAVCIAAVAWLLSSRNQGSQLLSSATILKPGVHNVSCTAPETVVPGCTPTHCARVVVDDFITAQEADQLIHLAETAMSLAGGSGPPTVLDLQSGAVSRGEHFIDVYRLMKAHKRTFDHSDIELYRSLSQRLLQAARQQFGIEKVWLTTPTFFSRIRGDVEAKTPHDEYWHPHIDKLQYGTFTYTGLIYLNDHGKDFTGGAFTFVDNEANNSSVLPKKGRLSMFTSGSENVHFVEKVLTGTRYALTIAFTCDEEAAVKTFLPRLSELEETTSSESSQSASNQ